MKHKKVIQVITENYEEEQYMLFKFPESWWNDRFGRMMFSISLEQEEKVNEAIKEYKELKNEQRRRKN